ncbi:D-tyrosyl-tRNA(Tyr) deacylase [Planctomycetaceae bacterium SCGC AG-212-F19]|nr:D-tyrosyl-tRNA(Tyr) deacylase [Planctomycetaceae bacterium SCGC AG-212-F19]
MRAVVQRVSQARVLIDSEVVGQIGRGLLVLLGITHGDTPEQADWLAEKIVGLRIFPDPLTPALSPAGERVQGEGDKMNRGLADVNGGMLIVSQFTLYGDSAKGRRPSFVAAAPPEIAGPLYERFIDAVKALGVPVASGRFGAMMQVELTNDGPVTLIVERKEPDAADLNLRS